MFQQKYLKKGRCHQSFFLSSLGLLIPILSTFLILACSTPESLVNENQGCILCHEPVLGESGIHKTHVNKQLQSEHPFFKSVMEASEDSLVPVTDSTAYEMYNCNICHFGYGEKTEILNKKYHKNGREDVVFDSTYFDTVFQFVGNMAFENSTCSNIPCHGTGREGLLDVTWSSSVKVGDKIDCTSCHQQSKHKTGVSCGLCHDQTTNKNDEIINYKYHINGFVEEKRKK